MPKTRRPAHTGNDGDDPPARTNAGIIPQEDEATGFLPVVEGDDSYDVLRMPHERDESVDPPPGTTPRAKRPAKRRR